ncbi:hypothetical protein GRZ55_11360 [Chelativorans sp. ZYF759]|uniref:hypothetical protein n=1 Tax=Chelativorans sp. ZYF759 TaxID=2692213 RepID=UPI00145C72B9|nr:hypothetical protein [Chelativorans sp. ZYF759]NMG39842.1 hypothetical protein [Chelativorans sp. ZYF759]
MIAFRPTPPQAPDRSLAGFSTALAAAGGACVTTRMAETMRELAFAGRNVERGALFLEGYSLAEIDAHWEAAASLARQRSVRHVGGAS